MWSVETTKGGFEGDTLKEVAHDIAKFFYENEACLPEVIIIMYFDYAGNKTERYFPKAIPALEREIQSQLEDYEAEARYDRRMCN